MTWKRPVGHRPLRRAILQRDNHCCHWCGRYADQLDHLIPLAAGGPTTADNCVAACARCNGARGARYRNRMYAPARHPYFP